MSEKYYIYNYCLNENLDKKHKDYCETCWIDVAHGGSNACAQQNWKYCQKCVGKGYKQTKGYTDGRKKREALITEATGYVFKDRAPMSDERKELLKTALAKGRAKAKNKSDSSQ